MNTIPHDWQGSKDCLQTPGRLLDGADLKTCELVYALARMDDHQLDLLEEFIGIVEADPSPERNARLDAWNAKLDPFMQQHIAAGVAWLKAEVAE